MRTYASPESVVNKIVEENPRYSPCRIARLTQVSRFIIHSILRALPGEELKHRPFTKKNLPKSF
jgi:hypothetical protein